MKRIETDVLVIGSGFGASAPALRLSEAGYRVTIVEKGPALDPYRDFRQTQDPAYLRRYLKGLSGDGLSTTYAEALGGASGFYEMVSLRAPSPIFHLRSPEGRPLWPRGLDRAALDPFYDRAEAMLQVEQIAPDDVPRTGLVFSLLMKRLGYSCDRAAYAVRGCLASGYCVTGCIYGAKQSLLLTYLPRAVEAGATILTGLEALRVRPLGAPRRVGGSAGPGSGPPRYEVLCRSTDDPDRGVRIRARLVVLGGGTIGSARLLLASRRALPGLSAHVGRNIAFNGSVKVAALLPDDVPDGDMYTGRSHPGMISYEFFPSHGLTIAAAKPLPLQIVASARLRVHGERRPDWWGEDHVTLMKQLRRRGLVLYALGTTPPAASMRPGPDGELRLRLPIDDALTGYYRNTRALLHSLLERSGCRIIDAEFLDGEGAPRDDPHFSTAHQTGSCRMGESKADGVVAPSGEVFGYPGLYVADGAAIPSSLAVNTSLTILANAERIAAGILERHPRPGR